MKLKSITKWLSILIGYSLLITSLNAVVLGKTNPTFFPTANYFVIAFVWIYRGFDSVLALGLGIVLMCVLLLSFIKLILHKNISLITIAVYLLDIVATIYLLANGFGEQYAVSIFFDTAAILLIVLAHKGRRCVLPEQIGDSPET